MKMRTLLTISAVICTAITAQADWDPGDGHKMHYPQLPDPNGWNVKVDGPNTVADDFLCTQSGPITDVHFWGSWMDDSVGTIDLVHLSIHDDDRSGPYSKPGNLLWQINLDPSIAGSSIRPWDPYDPSLPQGFYDPNGQPPLVAPNNHGQTWQVNLQIPEQDAFTQQEGNIYWLDIHVVSDWVIGQPTPQFGWKTSPDHFEDDAVYEELITGEWFELFNPLPPNESLDMAFVITPEPGSAMLAILGAGLCCLRRRKR